MSFLRGETEFFEFLEHFEMLASARKRHMSEENVQIFVSLLQQG